MEDCGEKKIFVSGGRKRRSILKNTAIVIVLLVLTILTLFGYELIGTRDRAYNDVMERNWDITLPVGYTCVYRLDENEQSPSIFGDGDRYHVLVYDEAPAFGEEIVWDKMLVRWGDAMDVLKSLNADVPEEIFSGKNMAYHFQAENNDVLWMIYDENQKTLYIIERFI